MVISTAPVSLSNIYSRLNYNLADLNYFQDEMRTEEITFTFKARVQMLQLKYRPHHQTKDSAWPLCNTLDKDNTQGFMARCPILQEIRLYPFVRKAMTKDELINILNGTNWDPIAAYVGHAENYENKIISQYF